uniref:Uncharacterized protein n=1 Tax=Arundo donax TaxID=35708 RepID=A0A0A9FVI7_ARUDO
MVYSYMIGPPMKNGTCWLLSFCHGYDCFSISSV